jgi:hypothetical protein
MRAASLVKGGQGHEDKDVLGPAVCVLICIVVVFILEACCG